MESRNAHKVHHQTADLEIESSGLSFGLEITRTDSDQLRFHTGYWKF